MNAVIDTKPGGIVERLHDTAHGQVISVEQDVTAILDAIRAERADNDRLRGFRKPEEFYPVARIPLAMVTNGRDAELLGRAHGKVLGTGMACIPSRQQAQILAQTLVFESFADAEKRDQALRILNVFDLEVCCFGTSCRPDPA